MGRPRKGRKREYKGYYERDQATVDLPESTLRYVKKPRLLQEGSDDSDSSHATHESSADNTSSDPEQENQQINQPASPGDAASSPHGLASNSGGSTSSDHEQETIGPDQPASLTDPASSPHAPNSNSDDEALSHVEEENGGLSESASLTDPASSPHPPNSNSDDEALSHVEEENGGLSESASLTDPASSPHPPNSNSDDEALSYVEEENGGPSESASLSDLASNYADQLSDLVQESEDDQGEHSGTGTGSDSDTDVAREEDEQEARGMAGAEMNDDDEEAGTADADSDSDSEDMRDPFFRLKSELRSLQEVKSIHINVSIAEIMLNALTLSKKHNWSHLEKEHVMKLLVSILGNIVPNSRYLLDQYFFTKKDMVYFFFCSECTYLLGRVPARRSRPNQIVCPNSVCRSVNVISDLSKASYFVTFFLPAQIEILLSDPNIRRKLVKPSDYTEPPDSNMTDIYHGSMYREFARKVVDYTHASTTRILTLTISVDSASLCRSFSGQSICPVFCMINELPPVLRIGNPLLLGLWFGKTKEKIDLLLPPIIEHIKNLSVNPFPLKFIDEEWLVQLFLIACCADSVARCELQGIHAHRGDFPCSWCLEEGEEWNGHSRVFRYSEVFATERTLEGLFHDAQEALRTKQFINGVKYFSPLAPAPFFHTIHGFIVDPMHAKDEGTTKAFLKAWLGEFGEGVPFYIGSPANQRRLNLRLAKVAPPKEFRKSVRKIKDLPYWTGRELDNWGLYLSISVLDGMLPNRYLKHWALFVQANYLLLSSELPIRAIDIAEELIEKFCSEVEHLYSVKMMRFNLHIARHFAANSRRWGQMFGLSAYGFEAGNQSLKKVVHNANYIPSQVCRALSEDNALSILKHHCENVATKSFREDIDAKTRRFSIELEGNVKFLGQGKKFSASEEVEWFLTRKGKAGSEFLEFSELVKEGCHYSVDAMHRKIKTNNSIARLESKQIVVIKNILYHEVSNEVWIVTCNVRCEPSTFCPASVVRQYPDMCFQYTVRTIDEDIELHSVSELQTVCVSVDLGHTHYVSPLANIINMY